MTEAIELVKVVWESKIRILLMKVTDDFVGRRWDLKEQWMVDKLDETVE